MKHRYCVQMYHEKESINAFQKTENDHFITLPNVNMYLFSFILYVRLSRH